MYAIYFQSPSKDIYYMLDQTRNNAEILDFFQISRSADSVNGDKGILSLRRSMIGFSNRANRFTVQVRCCHTFT